jgi:hypothetical protein
MLSVARTAPDAREADAALNTSHSATRGFERIGLEYVR